MSSAGVKPGLRRYQYLLAVVAVARCARRVNSVAVPAKSLCPPCDQIRSIFLNQTLDRSIFAPRARKNSRKPGV
jgi:hypothetical protein